MTAERDRIDSLEALTSPRKPSNTAHSVIWNYSGHACQMLVNLGVMAYIAHSLAVQEYGVFLFVLSLATNLNLLDMGIGNVLILSFVPALAESDSERLNDLLAAAFVALSVLGLVGTLILVLFSFFLPGPFTIPSSLVHDASILFRIVAFTIPFSMSGMALEQLYQGAQRFDRANQVQFLTSALQLFLSIAVLRAGFGIVGLAAIQLAIALLRLILLVTALSANVPGAHLQLVRFRVATIKPLLQMSKWAFLNNLGVYLSDLMIWSVLGAFGSMNEVAMFGVAMKMPRQLWNLIYRGVDAVTPEFLRFAAQSDNEALRRIFLRTHQVLVGSMLPFIVMGIVLALPLMRVWVGEKYAAAGMVMRWLLLATFSQVFGYAADVLLYSRAKIRLVAWVALCGGASSLICALILVPRYGAAGLAAGVAVSQMFVTCIGLVYFGCKVGGVAAFTLLKTSLDGLFWPLLILVADCALIWCAAPHVSSVWLVVAGVAGGCAYLSIWGTKIALPMYRNELTRAA